MRISDWSSDVCSSDLSRLISWSIARATTSRGASSPRLSCRSMKSLPPPGTPGGSFRRPPSPRIASVSSDEHTTELQYLIRISYPVLCLKNNNRAHRITPHYHTITPIQTPHYSSYITNKTQL